jgi:hypothetical protein
MTLALAQALAVVFLGVWLVSWGLSRLGRWFSLGHDRAEGIQKVHTQPTSRLGGVGIAMGLVMGTTYVWTVQTHGGGQVDLLLWLCLTALPVWLGGLAEDLTHKVGPSLRLPVARWHALRWQWHGPGLRLAHWPLAEFTHLPITEARQARQTCRDQPTTLGSPTPESVGRSAGHAQGLASVHASSSSQQNYDFAAAGLPSATCAAAAARASDTLAITTTLRQPQQPRWA